uniref:ATP synthase complex subunit 8 n=1 Tax=Anopheles gilesi TaxID=2171669 RepID=A0A343WCW2_9DIPT|nr:ATP synthase F0 subunit 8 [Anopheles gilesi]AWB98553.1 ATP synthase F0 subunit 8 [Anopheles gilesi]
MPQMAPINWLILFLIFSLTLMVFNILNYYCFNYSPLKAPQSLFFTSNKLNWKW